MRILFALIVVICGLALASKFVYTDQLVLMGIVAALTFLTVATFLCVPRGSLGHIGLALGLLITFCGLVSIAAATSTLGFPMLILLVILFFGFPLYAFFQYRAVRQDELRLVLAIAAESGAPLDAAIHAYREDRPRNLLRRFWEGLLLNVMIVGYYFTWHKPRQFDARLAQLEKCLDDGLPLSDALRETPGVASRETLLAVTVGEATGNLAGPLQVVSETRMATSVVEGLARLVYPIFIVILQACTVLFLMTYIVPKFEKIMADFRVEGPPLFRSFVMGMRWVGSVMGLWLLPFLAVVMWILVQLFINPSYRWWFPGVAFFYRKYAQGRMLKMLGMLLNAGRTVSQSLTLLRGDDYLGRAVQRRLDAVQTRVDQGQPLAESLMAQGLLPANMVALLTSATRANNLPWALQEAGDHLVRRSVILMHRCINVVAPLAVLAAGAFVAFTAIAMFMALIGMLATLGAS